MNQERMIKIQQAVIKQLSEKRDITKEDRISMVDVWHGGCEGVGIGKYEVIDFAFISERISLLDYLQLILKTEQNELKDKENEIRSMANSIRDADRELREREVGAEEKLADELEDFKENITPALNNLVTVLNPTER